MQKNKGDHSSGIFKANFQVGSINLVEVESHGYMDQKWICATILSRKLHVEGMPEDPNTIALSMISKCWTRPRYHHVERSEIFVYPLRSVVTEEGTQKYVGCEGELWSRGCLEWPWPHWQRLSRNSPSEEFSEGHKRMQNPFGETRRPLY